MEAPAGASVGRYMGAKATSAGNRVYTHALLVVFSFSQAFLFDHSTIGPRSSYFYSPMVLFNIATATGHIYPSISSLAQFSSLPCRSTLSSI